MCECGMDVCKGINMHSGCGTTSCVSHHVSCGHNPHSSGRSDIIVIKQECECSEQLEGFEGRVTQVEESSHTHLNKDVLDTIDATDSSVKCNGIELANADLSNVDTSGLFGTDGSGIDVQMFTTMLGLEEMALKDGSNIDVVEYSEQLGIGDLAKTDGSNIDTVAYSTQLGLENFANVDGSNVERLPFRANIAPRVVETLVGVVGEYVGDTVTRVSGIIDDQFDDMYYWTGSLWRKVGA